jgi:hypothetical protein
MHSSSLALFHPSTAALQQRFLIQLPDKVKTATGLGLLFAIFAIFADAAPSKKNLKRDVDTRYPYTGPIVPIGDCVDPTINGNGKGFPRLVEPPVVKPSKSNPSNDIGVVELSYIPRGDEHPLLDTLRHRCRS